MHRALIAERDPRRAAELQEALSRLWPELVTTAVHDGHAAWVELKRLWPQVLFTEIATPGLDGVELARRAAERVQVVFVTASPHDALQAFELGAADYLLQPVTDARLGVTVRRLKSRLEGTPLDAHRTAEPSPGSADAAQRPLRWISVQQGRELRLVPVEDICYLHADHKYVALVTASHEYLTDVPLKDLQARLDPEQFWPVHRGTIVNVREARSIRRDDDGHHLLSLAHRPEALLISPSAAQRFRTDL